MRTQIIHPQRSIKPTRNKHASIVVASCSFAFIRIHWRPSKLNIKHSPRMSVESPQNGTRRNVPYYNVLIYTSAGKLRVVTSDVQSEDIVVVSG